MVWVGIAHTLEREGATDHHNLTYPPKTNQNKTTGELIARLRTTITTSQPVDVHYVDLPFLYRHLNASDATTSASSSSDDDGDDDEGGKGGGKGGHAKSKSKLAPAGKADDGGDGDGAKGGGEEKKGKGKGPRKAESSGSSGSRHGHKQ